MQDTQNANGLLTDRIADEVVRTNDHFSRARDPAFAINIGSLGQSGGFRFNFGNLALGGVEIIVRNVVQDRQ